MATENDVSSIPDYESGAVYSSCPNGRFKVESAARSKTGSDTARHNSCLSVTPIIVDFQRLFQQENRKYKSSDAVHNVVDGVRIKRIFLFS